MVAPPALPSIHNYIQVLLFHNILFYQFFLSVYNAHVLGNMNEYKCESWTSRGLYVNKKDKVAGSRDDMLTNKSCTSDDNSG